jgi:hypothetical protein
MQESSRLRKPILQDKKPKIRLQKNISISFLMLRAAKIDRLKKYASFILQIKIKYLRYCLPLRSLNGSRECNLCHKNLSIMILQIRYSYCHKSNHGMLFIRIKILRNSQES